MFEYGMVGYGMIKFGMVWSCMDYDQVWYDQVWYGRKEYDQVWYDQVWYGLAWWTSGGHPPDYFHCLSSTPYRLHARNNNTRIIQFGAIQLLMYCGNAYMTTNNEERSGRITLESLHQWWQYESENLNLLWPLTYKDTWEEACFELKHVHTTQLEILCEQRSLN